MRWTIGWAAAALMAASVAMAQPGFGPGYGAGCGGQGCGPQGGPGYGMGNGMGMGGGNPLMTQEEREAHWQAMHSLKSVDDCKAYLTAHQQAMQERARERGLPEGRQRDPSFMCERMAAHGMFPR